jgi:hypothetical protein
MDPSLCFIFALLPLYVLALVVWLLKRKLLGPSNNYWR